MKQILLIITFMSIIPCLFIDNIDTNKQQIKYHYYGHDYVLTYTTQETFNYRW